MGFQLLFNSVTTIIKGINVSLNIVSNCSRCVRVFEFLVYLNAKAYIVILLGALHARDLSLSEGPFCLGAAAVYRVSVEFPFRLSRDFLREE